MKTLKIAEAAEATGLTPSTLRYYEKIGLIPHVDRASGQVRKYTEENLGWIDFIKCMRGAGLSIDSLKEYTEMYREGDSTIEARKELLDEERQKLIEKRAEIDDTITKINVKIAHYDKV